MKVVRSHYNNNLNHHKFIRNFNLFQMGAQWLSGRVLDSRPRGRGFEPHQRKCVVLLEQDTLILA